MNNKDVCQMQVALLVCSAYIFVVALLIKFVIPSPYSQRELLILFSFLTIGGMSLMALLLTIAQRGWMPGDRA